MALTPRARILLSALAVLVALAALVWWLSKRNRTVPVTPVALPSSSATPIAPTNNPTPAPTVSASATPAPPPTGAEAPPGSLTTPPSAHASAPPANNAQPTSTSTPPAPPPQDLPASASGLLIPVVGVRPDELHDTFNEARSEGRVHDAIDIMSPCGTSVVAAADGLIVKLFESVRGGTTIYERSTDDKLIYYYAHLKAYADGLAENKTVRRGETIAYVGDTGNAGPGNCHLHFAIWLITDPKHYWDGQNINPYPLLRGQRSEARGQ